MAFPGDVSRYSAAYLCKIESAFEGTYWWGLTATRAEVPMLV